ncbi:hypothetical protein [Halorubrum vacuolatum]|uniref:DUF4350 domain-containing protein n=1 Tax=Halorubrum vacuolatum TaxID=63740 RepID=A0A238V757_HALVU|nr:hypothetical protein [Halorubrum vacuolatum]SNR30265.1 hypothetical protein SAMN06264855_10243 [Halorubrum vacuolatum]
MNRAMTLAVAFVATFALILGGAAGIGYLTADGAETPPELENDHYLDEDLVHDGTPGEADVEMSSTAPPQTILIDPGAAADGGVAADPLALLGLGADGAADRDVRPLVNALIENGHEVRIHTPEPGAQPPGDDEPTALGADLAEADAFVTFRTEYADAEVEDIETFAENDGHVLLASDGDAEFDQPGAAALDAALGVTTEPGYVYNMEDHDLNYQRVYAEPDAESPVTDGVDRVVFQSATPVGTNFANAELRPSDGSQLSTTRASTEKPLLIHTGSVVMAGDSDFMSPENAQRVDNDVLIGNLADFLVENDRNAAQQPPESSGDEAPPGEPVPPEEFPEEEPPQG